MRGAGARLFALFVGVMLFADDIAWRNAPNGLAGQSA